MKQTTNLVTACGEILMSVATCEKILRSSPSKVTLPIEDLEPDLILGSVLVHISNQLTTGLAIFAGSTRVPNTQTHRQLQNVRH